MQVLCCPPHTRTTGTRLRWQIILRIHSRTKWVPLGTHFVTSPFSRRSRLHRLHSLLVLQMRPHTGWTSRRCALRHAICPSLCRGQSARTIGLTSMPFPNSVPILQAHLPPFCRAGSIRCQGTSCYSLPPARYLQHSA